MEKCSSIGLICMAVVDLLFCVITLCDSFLEKNSLVYHHKNVSYFFTLYGNFLQNVFIKVSTWSLVRVFYKETSKFGNSVQHSLSCCKIGIPFTQRRGRLKLQSLRILASYQGNGAEQQKSATSGYFGP